MLLRGSDLSNLPILPPLPLSPIIPALNPFQTRLEIIRQILTFAGTLLYQVFCVRALQGVFFLLGDRLGFAE